MELLARRHARFKMFLVVVIFGLGFMTASAITRTLSQSEDDGPPIGWIGVKVYSNAKVARSRMEDFEEVGAVFGTSWKPEDYKDLPLNWLECDGREFACSDYPKLAALLNPGTGTETNSKMFHLPDLRGLLTTFPPPPAGATSKDRLWMDALFLKQSMDRLLRAHPPAAREVRWLMRAR